MKKILHVIEFFNVAGAENVASSLAIETRDVQTKTEVLVLNEIGLSGKRLQKLGVKVNGIKREKKNLGFLHTIFILIRYLKTQKVDIVHAHNFTPWLFCVFANFLAKKRIMVTLHGMIENRNSKIKKNILRFIVQYTDKIIFVSSSIQGNFLGLHKNAKSKAALITNGINLKKFHIQVDRNQVRENLGVSPHDYLLVTVGRFYQIKNYERQVKLIANLIKAAPNIKLIIAARILAYADKIKALSKQLGVQNRVLLVGLRDDIPYILKASDLFVMSSFSEGTSLALMEAIAAGLPVVVSNVGGNPNLVKNGINGFLFDLEKNGDFEKKVLTIYSDEETAQTFSRNQKQIAIKFSQDRMIKDYKKIYNELSRKTIEIIRKDTPFCT